MTYDPEVIALLKQGFGDINTNEAEEIIALGIEKRYPSGTIFCHEGEVEEGFFVLLEGEVEVRRKTRTNGEQMIKRMGKGRCFGEMEMIMPGPRLATVIAVTPVRVIEFDGRSFQSLLNRNGGIANILMKETSMRIRELDDFLLEYEGEIGEPLPKIPGESEVPEVVLEFVNNVSHEIRRPLIAAKSLAQDILSGLLDGPARDDALQSIIRSVNQAAAMLNSIYYYYGADLILGEPLPVDVAQLLTSAVETVQPKAELKSVGVQLEIGQQLPKVFIDRESLERAIVTLLETAVRFCPARKEIVIRAAGEEGQGVLIEISDGGAGIHPDVFQTMWQSPDVLGKIVALGLKELVWDPAVARRVIEQQGGKVVLLSDGELCVQIDLPPKYFH